jgi:hypothetical protein
MKSRLFMGTRIESRKLINNVRHSKNADAHEVRSCRGPAKLSIGFQNWV